MTDAALSIDPNKAPVASDAAAEAALSELRGYLDALADDDPDRPAADSLSAALAEPAADVARFFAGLLAASPYLATLARRETAFLARLWRDGPEVATAEAIALAKPETGARDDGAAEPLKDLMRRVRVAKRRLALAVGIADAAGHWGLEPVTRALSDLADAALDSAVAHAVRDLVGEPRPLDGCGIVVLGMGKLGARELNYSSDIDVMVLYEPERLAAPDPDRLRQDAVRAVRTMMRVMDERTADGYVFRTDLRLRPDPSVTPLAVTLRAAETYYESLGQNWERAAMIKARAVAGDKALGRDFLDHIKPFVWRKHLDFAAISDIQSIKRQINAYRGGGRIAIEGHDVKIGRGGIREIEFYAQTQQLIWGGREPELRPSGTLAALRALHAAGHVSTEATEALDAAYRTLRRVEHRLQMINDEQTQKLPETPEKMAALGAFLGWDDAQAFRTALRATFEAVEHHYARLFEEAPELGGGGALVFTGTEDDPDTVETLTGMGFRDPSRVAGRIRVWHHGRYRATRSERSRQILTELMPRLLRALADTSDADEAFSRFDSFLEGLPAGVQLFSLFYAHPTMLDLVAEIMGSAPRLAEWLSRKPILLDSVLDPGFFEPGESREHMTAALAEGLQQARDFQDVLDITRRWANDRKFQIGVQLLRGYVGAEDASAAMSDVAEVALEALVPSVEAEFVEAHGRVPGGRLGVVALGKLGGRELMPRSDLDLVFVYDHPADVEGSDGDKPLGPAVYYLRLCQRLVTAITTETGEGKLFEVDTRLRPDGKSGPLATQLATFESYYRKPGGDAWTWEYMALTRARAIYGPEGLRERLETAIATDLSQPHDPDALLRDVHAMRRRIAREFPGRSPWDVKYRPGGLVDVEFVAQYLQLSTAGGEASIVSANTARALELLAEARHLGQDARRDLTEALALWRRLQIAIRLTTSAGESFDAETAPEGQRRLLVRIAGDDSLETLEARMETAAAAVRRRYDEIVGGPAEALEA